MPKYLSTKEINEILFITEEPETATWHLSFLKPKFQGGESVEISKEIAISLMKVIYPPKIYIGDLPPVYPFH